MANIYMDWSGEFDPYQDFAALGDATRTETSWLVPNFTMDSAGVKTFTIFGGEGLTYDPETGLPNGGTITSVSLMVLDYASSRFFPEDPASNVVVFQPLLTITDVELDAASFASNISSVVTLYNGVPWMDVIDHDDAVLDAVDATHIVVENTDGTFTEVIGTNLSIGPAGVSGEVSAVNHLDTDANGRAVLNTIYLDALLGLEPGSMVDAKMVAAALFDDEGNYFFNLFNEGDGTVTAIANGFPNGIGDVFVTDITDGPGSDFIINDTGFMGVNYGESGPIIASLSNFVGYVRSADGVDVDTLINVYRINGSEVDDVINAAGATLNFTLRGNNGADLIIGGSGNDFISGDDGDDVMDGGAGIDRLSYRSSDYGVTVSLAITGDQAGADGTDRLINFEELEGSQHDDNLTGDSGDNYIDGGDGEDTIYGGAGNDILSGNDGLDTVAGGAGNDTFIVDQNDDIVIELAGEGVDEVRVDSTVTAYTLSDNVENLTLYGESESENFNVDGTGNAGDNVLRGNAGVNNLAGLAGNDTYYVQNVDDTVTEAVGQGSDKIFSNVSFTNAANVEVLELTGSANINATGTNSAETLIGNTGANILTGNEGADFLFGGADGAVDTLIGGSGNDVYLLVAPNDLVQENSGEGTDTVRYLGGGAYSLTDNVERLELQGGANINGTGNSLGNTITGNLGANVLTGLGGNDTLLGMEGNDRLIGGAGRDMLYGGAGNDTFVIADANDALDVTVETAGNGIDTVESAISWTLAAHIEKLTLTGGLVVTGTGNALANTIDGATNTAVNTLKGLGGNDTYIVGAGDLVDEEAVGSNGIDTVETALLSYTLTNNVENLLFTGAGNFAGSGNALANTITGGSGADTLNGGAGADNLTGLGGNDTYVVDNVGDVVNEAGGGGTDTVQSSISWTLGADVENLTLIGAAASLIATGNANANTINGATNTAANTLRGLGGNDTYVVGTGDVVDEVIAGSGGVDTVQTALLSYTLTNNVENLLFTGAGNFAGTGNTLANAITGGAGADTLDGGAGADTLTGLAGNDTYIVDNAGDVVNEAAGGGTDTIRTNLASYSLNTAAGANIENLVYTGSLAFTGTGNALVNALTGGAGADTLDGGAGADTLTGLAGNDTYIVDNAGDVVAEAAGGGTDTIRTALTSYSLNTAARANVENLVYTGSSAFTGTGNALANALTGGAGADTLDGGAGADTLTGLAGNDTYIVDNAGDVVNEAAGGGTDTIRTNLASYSLNTAARANVENLVYTGSAAFNGTGNALANVLTGGSAANTLIGLAGNDTLNGAGGNDNLQGGDGNDILYGGLGNDQLAGGLGSDIFVFDTAPNATTNRDSITDFNVAADTIRLENGVFTALVGTGTLTAAQFRTGAAAADADDRIIYNSATGALIYDSNGNVAGGAVQFATVTAGLALTNADFVIV